MYSSQEPRKEEFLAHVRQDAHLQWQKHLLEDHLYSVGNLARDLSGRFDESSAAWSYLAGLWHDLGKYSDDFQHMIGIRSGYNPEAHLEGEGQPGRVNHSSAGALHARKLLSDSRGKNGEICGKILGYLIAGHHSGLPDWTGKLDGRLDPGLPDNQTLYQAALNASIPSDILNPEGVMTALSLPAIANPKIHPIAMSFWIRMLFSCLVDSDFMDTETFMEPGKSESRKRWPHIGQIKESFDLHMKQKLSGSVQTAVNQLRREILEACLDKASQPTGIYKLTVPTGGGKTLTGMAYALAHALHHGKDRIIYVLPFTSILEQTADVFREAFSGVGMECLVEHHSTLDSEKETVQSRLATENWDAPIILTTNVQFFESLFANRTSRCRKLHNIANSVVILDEAQQIPPQFKDPIEGALVLLAGGYNTTVLLSTATQPALDLPYAGELAPHPAELFEKLKRVEIHVPKSLTEPLEWEELSQTLGGYEKVLCIVNRREDANRLFRLIPPEGAYHLSALMCAAHRTKVIREIKEKLQQPDAIVRVISTQLVEAGVDMDFPVVYRALAGLDSIAQAAGRCNREGRLKGAGQVHVFVPPTQPPIGFLRKAAQCSREMLHGQQSLEQTPQLFQQYFELFYGSLNSHDEKGMIELLKIKDNQPHFQFREATLAFQLIDDSQTGTILIPYDPHALSALSVLEEHGPSRGLLRKLQRYTVSVPRKTAGRMLAQGDLIEILPGVYQLKSMDAIYHAKTGLDVGKEVFLETESCII